MKSRIRGCVVLLGLMVMAPLAAQQPVYESKPITRTATIQSIDTASRVVTMKTPDGRTIEVTAPEQMEGFDRLKAGDQVTATFFEAIAVQIRQPGQPAPAAPITSVKRKEGTPGSDMRKEQTYTVTVEAVDPKAPSVRVKGAQGRVMTLAVKDASQLQNVKPGDTLDVTYYQSLLVKVAPAPKK